MITSHMHVKAPGFPRHPKDDQMVNNFMSGFSLADAINSKLIASGYDGLQLFDEDWGWLIIVADRASNIEMRVTFSSIADPEGDKNSVVEAMIAIQPQMLTTGALWWKKDISEEVRRFSQTVFGFLRNTPGVEIIEEFADIK